MSRVLIYLIFLCYLLLLAGCGREDYTTNNPPDIPITGPENVDADISEEVDREVNKTEEAGTEEVETGEVGTEKPYILVTDAMGREVMIPRDIRHLSTLQSPITHIVAMLGGADKLVAIPSGNTRDVLFVEMFPSILELRTPRGNNIFNIEEIYVYPPPEVVLVNSASVNDERVLNNLEAFGAPVVAIEFNTLDELKDMVLLVGTILGNEERAQEYNDHLLSTLTMITDRVGDMPEEEKRVVYHAVNELLRTNTPHSLSGQWLPKMGVHLAGSQVSEESPFSDRRFINLEELLLLDPEFIIINGANVYDYIRGPQGDRLRLLQAYQNNNIYLLPMGITRWAHTNSIETPLAMKWVAQIVHPYLFEDIDMAEEIKDFYRRFFDFELSDELVTLILEGRALRDWEG